MPIPVSNGLNKGIASYLKKKKAFFQRFPFILKQYRQKKQTEIFSIARSGLWVFGAFENEWEFYRAQSPAWIHVHETWEKLRLFKAN